MFPLLTYEFSPVSPHFQSRTMLESRCRVSAGLTLPRTEMQLIRILQIMLLFRLFLKRQSSLWYITESHHNPISFAFQYHPEGLGGMLPPGQLLPASISYFSSQPREQHFVPFITFDKVRGKRPAFCST